MKKAILSVLMALLALAFYATDFKLDDGTLIIGELKGIREGNMYIIDSAQELHIVAMDRITEINTGSGDVVSIWKRRKPFMDIDPSKYQTSALVSQASDQQFNLLAPPPKYPSSEASLASINKALWTQVYIVEATLACAIIGVTVVLLTKKK